MNPMVQFLRQLSDKFSSMTYSAVINQSDAKQIAYIRQLQREMKKSDALETPFSKLNVVVFDLETTGFYPNRGDQILSIGAVKINGTEINWNETFYSLIHSSDAPPDDIVALTGITKEQLDAAPPVEKVLNDFYRFIQRDILVAHHASHERNFMQHISKSVLRTSFEHRIVDTSFLTKIVEPTVSLVTLDDCCTHYGIHIEERHHALHDALATAKLWSENVRIIQGLGFLHLREVYTHLAKK